MKARLKATFDIRHKYKNFDEQTDRQAQKLYSFMARLDRPKDGEPTLEEFFTHRRVVYNDALTAAISRNLTQRLAELPPADFETNVQANSYKALLESARDIKVLEALAAIEVTGSFEGFPFAFDEIELKLFLLSSVPPLALARVKKIEFRPLTTDEDKEDNTLGFCTYSDELAGDIVVISDSRIRERYQSNLALLEGNENAAALAELGAKNRMRRAIAHEFAHSLHSALPVAALKRWEDQRTTDPTNITAYVKDRHDKNHRHRYMEDFADSMALFIMQPEVLTVISPVRFVAMQQLFEDYMPLYAENLKRGQDHRMAMARMANLASGITDDQLKRAYLGHETDPGQ